MLEGTLTHLHRAPYE